MATLLADYIQNTNTNYPSHIDTEGKGGYRVVSSLTDRNKIPSGKRVVGMVVYVTADSKTYRCTSLTATDNSGWEEVTYGSDVDLSLYIKYEEGNNTNHPILFNYVNAKEREVSGIASFAEISDANNHILTSEYADLKYEKTSDKITDSTISSADAKSTTKYPSAGAIVNYIDTNYVTSSAYQLTTRGTTSDTTVKTSLSDISDGTAILLTTTSYIPYSPIPIVTFSNAAVTVNADKLYVASSTLSSLSATKATETFTGNNMHEYKIQFTASESFTPTFTGFGTIKWLDGETPTCTKDKSYEISICNGLGICAEFS